MKFLYILLLAGISASCSKEIEVDAPNFDVKVEKLTYKVGDTIQFNFSGKPENITFYSGKPGADYDFRERTEIEGGTPQVDLITQYGGGGTQVNSLRLMVSNDLTAHTKDAVLAATWTDITDRAVIAPNATITPSGTIDLTDIVQVGKPLFFALKFVGVTDANKAAGTWIFRGFNATTKLASGLELPIANLVNGGWQAFSIKNDANTWIYRPQYPDAVVLGGGKNAPESEDWYVSKPLFFTKVAPDTGTPIQYISGNRLDNYKFFGYDQPGTYTVTFVASNASVNEQKFVVKQLEITITP